MMNCRMFGGLFGVLLSLTSPSLLNAQVSAQIPAQPSVQGSSQASTPESLHDDSDITGVETELQKGNTSDVIAPVNIAPIKASPVMNYQGVVKSKASTDTVIIQKNYMPKTERFQAFGGLTLAPNDVFYRTMGFQFRMGYHFSEDWGVEVLGVSLSSTKGKDLSGLEGQNVTAKALVSPRSYLGMDVYFNSMYGKAAFVDRKILPFEIYQTAGIGKMNTADTTNCDSIHFGLGELFSISRSAAIRVDLSVMIYQSKNINGDSQWTNTILLSLGYGRFFPEATYR